MSSKDSLGDRIKSQYEDRTRYFLPRRTYTILRLDGKAFHTYTKGLARPFDKGLMADMDAAILATLPQIQGAVCAYTQSDEISILLTDFVTENTDAWFDGNIQKMSSVAASILTAEFNRYRMWRSDITHDEWCVFPFGKYNVAYFDCRAFTIPDRTEVMNYFRWRQQDCIRNSVSMVTQSNFSHKELHGKSQSDMHEMLHTKGINWATDFTDGEKNGRIILKEYKHEASELDKSKVLLRSRWNVSGAWEFTKDGDRLLNLIPKYE
jgi:tRNA(His) 5'-end guanylyltransferase